MQKFSEIGFPGGKRQGRSKVPRQPFSASGPDRKAIAHRCRSKKKKTWSSGSRQTKSSNEPRRQKPPSEGRRRRKQSRENRLPRSQGQTKQRRKGRRRLRPPGAVAAELHLPRGAAQAAPPLPAPLRAQRPLSKNDKRREEKKCTYKHIP